MFLDGDDVALRGSIGIVEEGDLAILERGERKGEEGLNQIVGLSEVYEWTLKSYCRKNRRQNFDLALFTKQCWCMNVHHSMFHRGVER